MSSTKLKIQSQKGLKIRGKSRPKGKPSSAGALENVRLEDIIRSRRAKIRDSIISGQKMPPLMTPICPICLRPLRTGRTEQGGFGVIAEVHEVLLTRGMVMKAPPEIQINIHNPKNCVALCSSECHTLAVTEKGKQYCVGMLVKVHGRMQVINAISLIGANLRNRGTVDEIVSYVMGCPEWNLLLPPLKP